MPGAIPQAPHRLSRRIGTALAVWTVAVAAAAFGGVFALAPALPGLVAVAGIAGLIGLYASSPGLRAWAAAVGLRRLTAFHLWRIPAALTFFWYGSQGLLPPIFVSLAGWGDLLAGLAALLVLALPPRRGAFLAMHVFGALDFLVAVGTGLLFNAVLRDPAMAPIADFPLVLIPLVGVVLSAVAHVMAFDLLARGADGRRHTDPRAGFVIEA